MTRLSHDRYCAEIVAQAELLRSHVKGADLDTPVSSCPGWSLRMLLRHLGGGQRWAETIVRTRATEPPSDAHFRELSGYTDTDPDALAAWVAEGATALADALREAGPDAQVWNMIPDTTASFYARRFSHETLLHGADAALAVGAEFTADEDVAIDAVDEWMELGSLPQMFDFHPELRELLAPGRTVHLHATDTAPEAIAEWLVDLTGDRIVWRRAHEKAAAGR
jgi:uncharacterized protein (TIGR03083 family)